MPHCPHCGEAPHKAKCRPQLATLLAESINDHREDLMEMAAMQVQIAELHDGLRTLSAEVKQWH